MTCGRGACGGVEFGTRLRLAGGGLLAVTIVGGDSGLLEIDLPCNALLMKQMDPRRPG